MAWITDAEAITRALHVSLSSDSSPPPAASRRWNARAPTSGRISKPKRKPRGGAVPPITYISADPANFREMVQQATGAAGLEPSDSLPLPSPVAPLQQIRLPTLDTSALFLDQIAGRQPATDFDRLSPIFPSLDSWGVM
ncbi:calmodulin-binding protein 25-like [Curcuma longa]|uniref:calmodulin-binding protein 25-like n=1 Tax=Curcuma longa TaxID=136217 RepID=UPI003D9FAF20